MKFIHSVRKQEIPWPTQRQFNREQWESAAAQLAEDEVDQILADAGIWVADTLDPIREEANSLSVWQLPFEEFSRLVIASSNRDFMIAETQISSMAAESEFFPIQAAGELMYRYPRKDTGAMRFIDILEQGIDVANLCLRIYQDAPSNSEGSPADVLVEIRRLVELASVYEATEQYFLRFLWLGWRVEGRGEPWIIRPTDLGEELLWEASARRAASLEAELSMHIMRVWQASEEIREQWLIETGGGPEISLYEKEQLLYVEFEGRCQTPPRLPPRDFVNELLAREIYQDPLLHIPLQSLGQQTALDLLRASLLMQQISNMVLEYIPKETTVTTPEELAQFCPPIHWGSAVVAIASALNLKEEKASTLIETLIWDSVSGAQRDLWFRPFVTVETADGQSVYPALLAATTGNIVRTMDHWLSVFQLPMEERGRYFQHHIVAELREDAVEAKLGNTAIVSDPAITLVSTRNGSSEEFDVLILLSNRIVVCEAKCQKRPASPVERRNYQDTLQEAALQAKRKAAWLNDNLSVAADRLGVDQGRIGSRPIPLVITNQPFGVGQSHEGVSVLDLTLLKWYLSRPYLEVGVYDQERGLRVTRSEAFYTDGQQMAARFEEFAQSPPPLQQYTCNLESTITNLPLRSWEDVRLLQFTNRAFTVSGSHAPEESHLIQETDRDDTEGFAPLKSIP